MREAVIIFLVGLILGTNYVHGTPVTLRERAPAPAQASQANPVDDLLKQSDELVNFANAHQPAGWPGMNLVAEIEMLEDKLNTAYPTASEDQQDQIHGALQRLSDALNLLNGHA